MTGVSNCCYASSDSVYVVSNMNRTQYNQALNEIEMWLSLFTSFVCNSVCSYITDWYRFTAVSWYLTIYIN